MAAGISSSGQIAELIQLARRRIGQVLLPAVLTGALGVMAGSLLPAKYQASTTMQLATIPPPLVDAGLNQDRLRDRMRAADKVLRTFDRMDAVLSSLEWEHYSTLSPDERLEFVRKLHKDLWIKVEQPDGTNLLFMEFGYRDTDPQRAAQFANRQRDYFVDSLIEEVTDEARDRLDILTKDFQVAEEALDSASRRLDELRKDHKISPTQTFGNAAVQRETDPLYNELTREEAERLDLGRKVESHQARLAALIDKREGLPEKIKESETQYGGVELFERVKTLRELIQTALQSQVGKRPAHSAWRKAEADIKEYEQQIALLESRSVDPTQIVKLAPNPERAAVDDQIAVLELELAQDKARLSTVERHILDLEPRVANRIEVYSEFERATSDNTQAMARRLSLYAQKEIQRRLVANLALPDFTPFAIHQEALPPTKPSSPSALIVVAGGLILGLAIGALYALVAEFGRNGYRSPGDLARALPAPVLGAVNEIVTARERRQRAFRSGLAGAATLILAGSVLWITWAFHTRPGLLGPELTSWLDEMRGQFR